VTVLDALTYAGNKANLADLANQPRFEFVKSSITNAKRVDELASDADAIVNFAALTHVDRSVASPLEFIRINVQGTAILCDAARRHGHKAFLQVSTDEVYGHVPRGRSKEEDPLRPRSPYSASKAASEMVAYSYLETFGLPLLVTRGSNTYGPFQFPEKLIPVLITNAIDGLPLPLYNDGSAVRDFLFVEDYCRAIDLVLREAPLGKTYNVGTGVQTSGKQVAQSILAVVASGSSIEYVRDRPGHDYRYAPDTTRITELGWKPRFGIGDGLKRTVDWYRRNENWWRPLKEQRSYRAYYRKNYRPLEPAE
jgi:dTDP-glucose 4,6-dehydratase